MRHSLGDEVRVLTVNIFGTTVDWRSGVAGQVAKLAAERGVELDSGALADAWREQYLPSMARVRTGQRPWADLDALHRESLNEILELFGVAGAFDEQTRQRMVRTWHRLPAWDDVEHGLRRLRERYLVVALSNGGFALLTHLLKSQGLVFDAIVSAQEHRYLQARSQSFTAWPPKLLDVAPEQMLMVAAHGWDIDGARAAGLRTAFVERPDEKGPNGVADRAADTVSDITAAGFIDLAESLGC